MFDLNYNKVVDVIPDQTEFAAIRKDVSNLNDKENNPKRILKIIYYKRKKHNISWLHITDEETSELFEQVSKSLKILNAPPRFDDSTTLEDCFLPTKKAMAVLTQMRCQINNAVHPKTKVNVSEFAANFSDYGKMQCLKSEFKELSKEFKKLHSQ